ncbi:winged helix-turn-helix domain-containing protein [Paraburkholderia sp. DD10]|uniref:winged helix-turn-helix domain-containing protein n=1 Tax=Paraburkholderia sp. DD10 TaxID=3409691 RepID=UPI0009F61093|nr:transcriptional regulator [Burkholderia sp. A27]
MIELGRFHIDLEMRTLRKDGEPVHLGSRAFDILAVVASAGGRLVTKDELMNAVWPNTIVEENNIQVHLSALRKILGADRDLILTVPGRGYQLVRRSNRSAPGQSFAPAPAACPLPPPKTHLVGREAAVRQIRAMLAHAHVLTLVGAGGIGKTSLAIEAARHAAADFVEVCFVELAALTAHGGVLAAIAEGCGLAGADAAPGVTPGVAQMAAALAQKRRLLVLDNAEHLVDEVAEVVEALVAECASLRVLVTSREPLRIMPEAIFRVDPLDVPQPDSSDAEILQQSAVNLFLLRANSLQRKVGAERAELRLVGEICRRLDGIPLALELAAARVVALGVEGVYQRLDDRMAILAGGYRTALPRHQTLRATFDWSFALLDAGAQSLFRRIAVFGGLFTFEAMCAVVCDAGLTVASAINGISELLAKSLVNVEFDGPVARYRLSESTRAYALEKLQAEGERQDLAARHARYLACCLQARPARTAAGAATSTDSSAADHAAVFQHSLDDACSALDWAFSPEGDVRLGVELASNLAGALLDAGMIAECCARTGQAVDALDKLPAASVAAVSEMRVRAALASALPYIHGAVGRSAELWRDVLALALACGDEAFHARALWGLWNTMMSGGNIHESMKYAKRFQQFTQAQAQAQENPWQQILADQLVAISLHCLGRHGEARQALLDVRQRIVSLDGKAQRVGSFAVDPLVYCNGTLARIAWLEGNVGEALALVDQLVSLVRPHTMEPSLTHVLGAAAAPLALLSGDLSGGAAYLEIMRSQAALHRSEVWLDYCDCLSAYRDILDGHAQRALPVLAQALDALIARGFRRLITLFIVAYAEALVTAGQIHEARSRLNEALAFCESNGELIFLPEIWRVLGLAAHAEARAQAYAGNASNARRSDASACFAKAIELSRTQGARMWELRASMALAALLRDEGRTEAALELLERIALCFDAASGSADVDALFETIGTLRSRSGKPLRRAAFDTMPPLDTRAALAAPASAG